MILVLDSSAGVGVSLGRREARHLGETITEANWVIAPSLYVPEVSNAFWKYHQFGQVPIDQCRRRLRRAIALPDDFVESHVLHEEAFALACTTGMPVYDMLFLVLARRHDALLATLDHALRSTAQKQSIRTV